MSPRLRVGRVGGWHEYLRNLYPAAHCHQPADGGHRAVWGDCLQGFASQRSAAGGLPHHHRFGQPARRQSQYHGFVSRDSPGAAVHDHRRGGLHDLLFEPGQQQHHSAIRPQPRYRWRHGGRGDRHCRGHAPASAGNAHAAFLSQGESRRQSHHQPVSDVAHHAALGPRRVCRSHGGATDLDGLGRGPSAGVRVGQVRRSRAGGPECTGGAADRPERNRHRDQELERQPAHRHALRPQDRLPGAGQRAAYAGGRLPAHDRHLSQRRPGALERSG